MLTTAYAYAWVVRMYDECDLPVTTQTSSPNQFKPVQYETHV